jgi:hypothetical protein
MKRLVLVLSAGALAMAVAMYLLRGDHANVTTAGSNVQSKKLPTPKGVLFENSQASIMNSADRNEGAVGVTVCLRQTHAEEEKWFATPCRANTWEASFPQCRGRIAPPCQPVTPFADDQLTTPLPIPFPVNKESTWQFYMPAGCYKVWLSKLRTGESEGPAEAELICSGPGFSRPVTWK